VSIFDKNFFTLRSTPKENTSKKEKIQEINPQKTVGVGLPTSRVSVPDLESSYKGLKNSMDFVTPDFQYEYIPIIRKLFKVNSSVFRSTVTLTELINSGFSLEFDSSVTDEVRRDINQHLKKVYKTWGLGTAGIHGIINKMVSQIYVGGALSVEWVLNRDLTGIDCPVFVNPENVRVRYNTSTGRYDFYQVPHYWEPGRDYTKDNGAILLNPITYRYYGLFTDEESPIGTPPFLSALDDIQSQLKMLRNIGFVTDQLGLMGFLEVMLSKPLQADGEKDTAYIARLAKYLNDAKAAIKDGTKDGVVAGFKDEHEFDFHATTKDTSGVADIFNINQRMVSNGLLSPSQFLGGEKAGAETGLGIIFTMLLSQLNNIQQYISEILETGIWMELTLAGFKFDWLEVKFDKSTVTDTLKEAQSEEIKIRNSNLLYAAGIISQATYANRHGFDAPDQEEPRVEIDPVKAQAEQVAKDNKQDQDNKSNQKTREKEKTQPKRKDQK